MTGVAVKAQGSTLAVGSAVSGGALAITALTAASPVVATVTNTFVTGDLVVAAAILGPQNLNNRAFIVAPVSGTSATLKGEDGSSNATYVLSLIHI